MPKNKGNSELTENKRGFYSIPKPTKIIKKNGEIKYYVHNITYYDKAHIRHFDDTGEYLTPEEAFDNAKFRISKHIENGDMAIDVSSSTITFGGLLEQFKAYNEALSLDRISAGTKDTNINRISSLIKILKKTPFLNKKLSVFSEDDVSAVLDYLKEEKYTKARKEVDTKTGELIVKQEKLQYSPKTYSDFRTQIKNALAYGKKKNYFYNSQGRYDRMLIAIKNDNTPKKQKETLLELENDFRFLTYDEFLLFSAKTLYDSVKDEKEKRRLCLAYCEEGIIQMDKTIYRDYKYFVYFTSLFFLGLRNEECRVLLKKDISLATELKEGRVNIYKAVSGHHKKKDREEYYKKQNLKNPFSSRFVPIHPRLNKVLKDYIEYAEHNHLLGRNGELFPGQSGRYISDNAINKKINKIIKTMNPDIARKGFSKHDFRRSCAMWLCYDRQIELYRAYRFFGHRDSTMLIDVYTYRNKVEEAKLLSKDFNAIHFFSQDSNSKYDYEGNIKRDDGYKETQNEYYDYYNKRILSKSSKYQKSWTLNGKIVLIK